MRRLTIITDAEPSVRQLFNSWEVSSGRIEGDVLTAKLRNKSILIVEAVDPQMVADIVLSHDPSSEIVTGKLGIRRVKFEEHIPDENEAVEQLKQALKAILNYD